MATSRTLTSDDRQTIAERLKERIYVTFTSLTVVLALSSHAHDLTAGKAATTLLIAVGGTLLAVFVADFISHTVAHTALPTRSQLRHMVGVVANAIGVVIVPLILLGLAALDVMNIELALSVSSIVLVATLGLVGFLAVRRVQLGAWLKVALLAVEVILGLAVVGLELLAHG
ncbi:hypothetical protein L1277_002232 [Okibacterium sp. HSC-33S16]|uniref:hypothetical protein n=1 Tax=Okibacterium sp. HSC-33S16 TaxID=2910965 RepID=UPI00209FA079|nr:hypothetical protein [Okibacterium sp. HSC-33S16]MCP2032133.1 hypothetical protein [Okibacterium sp. HSC-33S16]